MTIMSMARLPAARMTMMNNLSQRASAVPLFARPMSSLAGRFEDAETFLNLKGTDHVELYTSNAKQSAHWLHSVMGFQPFAYSGLETGIKDRTSYALKQGKITLVVTASFGGAVDEIGDHVKLHGDGVRKMALEVDDARQAFAVTTSKGAVPCLEPTVLKDESGEVVVSGIKTFGDTIHWFIERKNYKGVFLPGFVARQASVSGFGEVGLKYIDHMVGNVEKGQMDRWVKYYREVFGFAQLLSFDDKDISTEYTALQSKVVTNRTGYVKYPINEPADGLKKSQIQEYLEFYKGPGVQHIAVASDNLEHSVSALKNRGCQFLDIPDTYYEDLEARVGKISEPVDMLREHKLLVDRDEAGYMIQIFTRPISDRPTLFFEIIQRKGALSFGKGNFKALFESIERDQSRRGTL